jgi:hypothetical protein
LQWNEAIRGAVIDGAAQIVMESPLLTWPAVMLTDRR